MFNNMSLCVFDVSNFKCFKIFFQIYVPVKETAFFQFLFLQKKS